MTVSVSAKARFKELEKPNAVRMQVTAPICYECGEEWSKDSLKARKALNLTCDDQPWTQKARILLKGLSKSDRARDNVNLVWAKACTLADRPFSDQRIASNLYSDVSQAFPRGAWGAPSSISQSDNTTVYSFKRDRIIHPKEMVLSLGYRRTPNFDGISNSRIRELSGQAICLPALATLLYPTILVMDFGGLWENEQA